MKYISLFSGIEAASCAWSLLDGWKPIAFSEIEKFPCSVLKTRFPDVVNMGDITRINRETIEEVTNGQSIDLVVGGSPCQDLSVGGGVEQEYMESVLDWPSSILDCSLLFDLNGYYGKTSPEYYRQIRDETSKNSSRHLMTQGMVVHGECLTQNTSESVNGAEESFLWDILETGDLPQRYYLSAKACQGILRRAEEHKKILPKSMKTVLERQSQS